MRAFLSRSKLIKLKINCVEDAHKIDIDNIIDYTLLTQEQLKTKVEDCVIPFYLSQEQLKTKVEDCVIPFYLSQEQLKNKVMIMLYH